MSGTANACIFCDIVAGRAKGHRVHEDEHVVAFLDIRPLFPGHVLVVPRIHHETLPELPPALVEPLFSQVRRVADAVEVAMNAQGTFVAINNTVSQAVPHLHVHVVPRNKGDGLRGFFWPRQKYGSDGETEAVADAIRRALAPSRHAG